MRLTLKRSEIGVDGAFGQLLDWLNNPICVTLEHSYLESDGGYSVKIPPGVYACVRGTHALSNGVPFETFEIIDIPRHVGILFHKGNLESDSHGCVLLGSYRVGKGVYKSGDAFAKFLFMCDGIDEFELEVL